MKIKFVMTAFIASMLGILSACGQKKHMPEGALLSIEYTRSGTMAGYEYEAHVDRQDNGSVLLRASYVNHGPLVVKYVDESTLKELRDIIEEEKIYAYKDHYTPPFEVLDGYGWHLYARFENHESISTGGSNAGPDGNGLGRIIGVISKLIGDSKPKGWLEEDKDFKWEGSSWTDGFREFRFDNEEDIVMIAGDADETTWFDKSDWRLEHKTSDHQELFEAINYSRNKYYVFERTDKEKTRAWQQLRNLRMLCAGTYQGKNGKTYIFTRDGMFKNSDKDKGIAYSIVKNKNGYTNVLRAGANQWLVCLTDSGMNLYQPQTAANGYKRGKLIDVLKMTDNASDNSNGFSIPGRWAVFSEIVADKHMLSLFPPKVLKRISDEILARYGHGFYNDEEAKAYFKKQPWYDDDNTNYNMSPVDEINSRELREMRDSKPTGPWPWFESE
ncbi:MAG: YARHG domain-containing protein [Prevotella sp.]|nr:YARHG domain-containing protein [Prevotella sp.]